MSDASTMDDILDLAMPVPLAVLEGIPSTFRALVVVSTAGADSAVVIGLSRFDIGESDQRHGMRDPSRGNEAEQLIAEKRGDGGERRRLRSLLHLYLYQDF